MGSTGPRAAVRRRDPHGLPVRPLLLLHRVSSDNP